MLYAVSGWSDIGIYWILIPIFSTVSFSLIFSWYRFRLQFMDMILNQFVSLSLLVMIVVGFSQISNISIEEENEEGVRLLFYTVYVLFAFAAYMLIATAFKRIWRPSDVVLMQIHEHLPQLLAKTTDQVSARATTADFIADLFQCEASFNQSEMAPTIVNIDDEANLSLSLGYIRGWVPWMSEALAWVRTAGLYLQSHEQVLLSLQNLHEQNLKNEELSSLALRAELDAMRAQIRPHFLFNTLNSIHSFVRDEPDQAEKVIELLADMMRGVLQSADRDFITLKQELDPG